MEKQSTFNPGYCSHYQVYYLDYGFFVETSQVNMLELHQEFLSLPFQATCVRLAGTEKLKHLF